MKTIIITLVLLISTFKTFSQEYEQFRLDYTIYAVYDNSTMEWGDWIKGENTFVINANGHGDVKHFTHSRTEILYKKISAVQNNENDKGDKYQEIKILDEVGNKFFFIMFEDPNIGIMIVDEQGNQKIQFTNNNIE